MQGVNVSKVVILLLTIFNSSECSRFTKENTQLNARETLEKICKRYENIDEMFAKKLKIKIEYELNKLGL